MRPRTGSAPTKVCLTQYSRINSVFILVTPRTLSCGPTFREMAIESRRPQRMTAWTVLLIFTASATSRKSPWGHRSHGRGPKWHGAASWARPRPIGVHAQRLTCEPTPEHTTALPRDVRALERHGRPGYACVSVLPRLPSLGSDLCDHIVRLPPGLCLAS
jgi:hypothetical protein